MGDIAALRSAINVITKILADKDIEVTQRGTRAHVTYDKRTGMPSRVNLPFLPDDASDDLILAVHGFLDHEVAHLIYSDYKVINQSSKKENAAVDRLFNIIEDTRIERLMSKRFKGSAENIESALKFLIDRVLNKNFEEAKNEGTPKAYGQALLMAAVRAWAGQPLFQEFMKDKWDYIKPIVDLMDEDDISLIQDVQSSKDALTLARALYEKFDNQGGGGEDGDDDGDGDGQDQDSAGNSKSKSNSKNGSSGDSGSSDDSDEDASGGSSDGDDHGEDEDGDGDQDQDGDGSEGQNDSDPDEDEDEDGEGDKSESGDDDDEEDGEDNSDGDTDDEDGDEDVGNDDAESENEDDEDGDAGLNESGDNQPSGGFGSNALSGLADSDDASDAIAKELSEESANHVENLEYRVFTTDYDTVAPFDAGDYQDGYVQEVEDRTRALVGPLQRSMERIIVSRRQSRWQPGLRSGKINSTALHRLKTGDDRVFRRKSVVSDTKDVAVSLVVDCSGSMWGPKIELAMSAAFAMTSVLTRLGIEHEVIGFTTGFGQAANSSGWAAHRDTYDKLVNEIREECNYLQSIGKGFYEDDYGRIDPISMLVFKGFDERFGIEQRRRIATACKSSNYMSGNADGDSIAIAQKRLLSRRADGHVMFVLSDGHPAAYGNSADQYKRLKTVVREGIDAGIKTYGIGIQDSAVSQFYPTYDVLKDIKGLPQLILGRIQSAIIGS